MAKKSPNQETCLGYVGRLKVLNWSQMIKGVTHVHLGLDLGLDLGPIWYHSEPSTYFPHQFLGWDFFAASYSKKALVG